MRRGWALPRSAFLTVMLAAVWCVAAGPAARAKPPAPDHKATIPVAQGGLAVFLGTDAENLAELYKGFVGGGEDGWIFHGLFPLSGDDLRQQRDRLLALGLNGRVSMECWPVPPVKSRRESRRLPYATGTVNVLIGEAGPYLSEAEVRRVLVPGGTALLSDALTQRYRKIVKPRPAAMDDWTHTLHDATNNAVAKDTVVAPPRRFQWIGSPRNARHHERLASVTVVLSAGGRLFSIVDEGPTASILLPPSWSLIARDAYNGIVLWKRTIPSWESHLRAFRMGPPDLGRRMVVTEDRVYVTLGLDAPVSVLDARTGRTLKTLPGTQRTDEILLADGVLYLVARSGQDTAAAGKAPATAGKAPAAARRAAPAAALPAKRILAMTVDGKKLWEADGAGVLPVSLTVGEGRVFYMDAGGLVALDARTGQPLWRARREVALRRPAWSSPTVVVSDGVVICADRQATPADTFDESLGRKVAGWLAREGYPGDVVAHAAADGKELWRCRGAESYHAQIDVFVIDGIVWVGQSRSRTGPDFREGRDLKTGKVVRRIKPDQAFQTTMPHHRCHRNRATSKYLVTGRTGVEFIDVVTGKAQRNHWTRGTCQFGTIPCNGLLYVPPHSCACYIEAKMTGFLAYAGADEADDKAAAIADDVRLEKGAAYPPKGKPSTRTRPRGDVDPASDGGNPEGTVGPQSEIRNPKSDDWPTLRHDAARTGATVAAGPREVALLWRVRPGARVRAEETGAKGKAGVAGGDERARAGQTAGGGDKDEPAGEARRGERGGSGRAKGEAERVQITAPVVVGDLVLVAATDQHTVYALDAATGRRRWHATAGGRVDSPPSVARGLAVFGSADGCVYCVRLADGEAVWRFRAAPAERRIVVRGQLESAWPVHGSVLIRETGGKPNVYFAAGRSSYVDGGIWLYRLDLVTGELLARHRIQSRPDGGDQPGEPIRFEMAGARADVLSGDDERIYMRRLAFDPETLKPTKSAPHLYAPAGFLNGDWWHRTYWIYGEHFYSGYIGWYFAGRENPAGRILAVGPDRIYGFGYKPSYYRGATGREYCLHATDKTALPDLGKPDYGRANRDYPHSGKGKFHVKYAWQAEPGLLGRAMVLCGKGQARTLFLAGPPAEGVRSIEAYTGKRGVMLLAARASDGKTLGRYQLPALPVFDGLAAAGGKLYLSLEDGSLLCLGSPGSAAAQALPEWKDPPSPGTGKPKEPGLIGHWTFDEGTGAIAKDSSGRGLDADCNAKWTRDAGHACVAIRGRPGAVTIPDCAALHFGPDSLSIAFRVKLQAYHCRIMGKEAFPKNWWTINVLHDGRAELVLGSGLDKNQSVRPTSKTPLAKDGWTHVAFVADRQAGAVTCYLNGRPDSTTKIPAGLGPIHAKGKPLRIPSSHKPFTGLFDDLILYRRALTAEEVKRLK